MKYKTLLTLAISAGLASPLAFSEKTAKEELDILSAEANDAANEKAQTNTIAAEPEVEASADTDVEKLSTDVTNQLAKILGESTGDTIDKETEDKIEKVISSSLLGGADIKDIRSAVNSALVDLKGTEGKGISDEKLASASASIDKLVGTEDKSAGAEDSYLSSLRAEAEDVNEPAFNNEPKPKKANPPEVVETVAADPAFAEPKKEVATAESKPAKVVAKTSPATKSADNGSGTYETVTVQKDESLYKIALRVYGNGALYAKLYEANKDSIADPNLISVGQVLKVPR